ncbi:MAG TPA: FecR domain-containing protein [Gemmatimonadaceae bacterium]|jgi:transmembrane sensor|nr:FecR domain-containing protein [Gemmatimonadaceae bacterium]
MSNPRRLAELAEKYLTGTCTSEELAELERLTGSRPPSHVGPSADAAVRYDTAGALARVSAQLGIAPEPRAVRPRRGKSWAAPLIAAAAIVVAGAFGIHQMMGKMMGTSRRPVTSRYIAARGERKMIVLPDGSRATLGAGSTLAYAAGSTRDAQLIGEAVFEVVHDTRHEFRVHAGATLVRDIGTVFVVRALDPARPTVAVASGTVAVSDSGHTETMLAAGDVLAPDPTGQLMIRRHTDVTALFDWRAGVLHYADATVAVIAADLARQYDLDIVPPPSAIGRQHLDATFDRLSADSALRRLARLAHARYTRHGQTITFSAR